MSTTDRVVIETPRGDIRAVPVVDRESTVIDRRPTELVTVDVDGTGLVYPESDIDPI